MLRNPRIENPTSLGDVSGCSRFFIFGEGKGAHRLHLLLAGRFETRFFGFFSKGSEIRRDATTSFLVRPLEQHLDHLGQGDYLFLFERDENIEEILLGKGVRLGYPFSIIHVYSTYEAPIFHVFLQKYFCIGDDIGTALDIGANFGLTSTMMSPYFSSVHAFEPNRAIFENLSNNHTLPPNVHLHQCAFGEKVGVEFFYDSGGVNGSLLEIEGQEGYEVPVDTIDNFCSTNKISPRLIKIDAEGKDADIMLNAEGVIRCSHPIIFFENIAAGPHANEKWLLTRDFLYKYYDLYTYQCLNALFQSEDIGLNLEEFTRKYEQAPLNIAAVPK